MHTARWGAGIKVSHLCKAGKWNEALNEFNISPDPMGASCLISSLHNQRQTLHQGFVIYNTLKKSKRPDEIVFFSLVNACKQFRSPDKAITILEEMIQANALITEKILNCALAACSDRSAYRIGKQIHTLATNYNVPHTVRLYNSLIAMYTRCCAFDEALSVFKRMCDSGIQADHYTFGSMFAVYGGLSDIESGKDLHSKAFAGGYSSSIIVCNSIMQMYAQWGNFEEVAKLWQHIRTVKISPTLVTYATVFKAVPDSTQLKLFLEEADIESSTFDAPTASALFTAYLRCEMANEAILLWKNKICSMPRTVQLYTSLIGACSHPSTLEIGRFLHKDLVASGIKQDIQLATALINMYTNCADPHTAILVWNELDLHKLKANEYTYSAVLNTCAEAQNFDFGEQICQHLNSMSTIRSTILETAIVKFYFMCGKPVQALNEWQHISNGTIKLDDILTCYFLMACTAAQDLEMINTIVGYMSTQQLSARVLSNILIGFLECDATEPAYATWKKLIKLFQLECWITQALATCANQGRLKAGHFLLDKIGNIKRNTKMVNCIIFLLAQTGDISSAAKEWEHMENMNVTPNEYTYCAMLSACASAAAYSLGSSILSKYRRSGIVLTPNVSSAIIDMFSKCGELSQAEEAFREAQKYAQLDVAVWNSMIGAYGLHGEGVKAQEMFQQMQHENFKPNDITFASLLNACSHAGLVNYAIETYHNLPNYGVIPNIRHQTCVVDALARAGRLEEAEKFIEVEIRKDDLVVWMALLGACRSKQDVRRAERVARKIHELDPSVASAYVLMANTYASSGHLDQQGHVQATMRDRAIKKVPGRSLVEVNGEMHSFVANDGTHKEAQQIHKFVQKMYNEIKTAGYKPQIHWVVNKMEEGEDKEERLCQHSEKLAIGFAMMHTPATEPIRVIKNLRVCGDCHESTKFISKHYNRTIIVRDANRFHRIEHGSCSCKDYW